MRDEFPRVIVETLAKRVGNRCSNPTCRKRTSGPHTEDDKALNLGVAAHISAASPGGPRYDPSIISEERKSVGNGIWLCQFCVKLVDNDDRRFTKSMLIQWKHEAEQEALDEIESPMAGLRVSDVDALKEFSVYFDRAALQDSLRGCGSYKKFAQSLTDLISLLNTGVVQDQQITKRRADFDNPIW